MKLFIIIFILILTSYFLKCEEPFWEYISGPPTGLITDIKLSSNNNIYINGTNGIFISTDNGYHWNRIFTKTCYFMDISKDENIFILCSGMYHSSNNGSDWININEFWESNNAVPSYIIFNNSDYLYSLTYIDNKYGLYRSADKGNTWNVCEFELEVDINNKERNRLSKIDKGCNDDILIGGYNNSYTTTNGWENTGLLFVINKNGDIRKKLTFTSSVQNWDLLNNSTIIVATNNETLLTFNEGETWETILDKGTKSVVALNENEFLCGTFREGVYYTSDRGKTWEKRTNGLRSDYVEKLKKGNNGEIYSVGYTGFHVSTDKGLTWECRNNSFTAADVEGIAFDSKGCVYAVDRGVYRSCDHGETWEYLGLGNYNLSEILITQKEEIIVGSNFSTCGIIRSDDNGKTWEQSSIGLSSSGGEYQGCDDIIEASDGSIYAALWIVYRSTDGGRTWIRPDSIAGGISFCLAENSEGHIFAGNYDSEIIRSTDKGKTWTIVNPTQWLEPGNNGDVFFIKGTTIGYKGFIPWKTIDNGRGWMKMYGSERIKGDHFAQDSLGTIYSCSAGVFRSFDTFSTYEKLYGEENGLYHVLFKDIEVSPDGYIYLGVENGGMYRSRDRFVSVIEPKKVETNFDIMPIPTEDILKINYDCPLCKIEIYTLLGTKLIEIPYTEEIDVSWLSPGIYIIRIGDKVRKFVIGG